MIDSFHSFIHMQVTHAQRSGAAAIIVVDLDADSELLEPLRFAMSDDGAGMGVTIPSLLLHASSLSNHSDSQRVSADQEATPFACAIGLRPRDCTAVVDYSPASGRPGGGVRGASSSKQGDSVCSCDDVLAALSEQASDTLIDVVARPDVLVSLASPDILQEIAGLSDGPTVPSALAAASTVLASLFRPQGG